MTRARYTWVDGLRDLMADPTVHGMASRVVGQVLEPQLGDFRRAVKRGVRFPSCDFCDGTGVAKCLRCRATACLDHAFVNAGNQPGDEVSVTFERVVPGVCNDCLKELVREAAKAEEPARKTTRSKTERERPQPKAPPPIIDFGEHYRIAQAYLLLGLRPGCTLEDVRHQQRVLAKQHHPDAGGDAGMMQEINRAASILERQIHAAA